MDTNSDRVKNRSTSRRTVIAVGWVPQPISNLIDRRASDWHVSRSMAIRMLVERGIKNDLFADYEQMIQETVERTITRENHKIASRVVSLLFRMYTLIAQILHLQINLLSRSGIPRRLAPEQLDHIIAWSRQLAGEHVTKRSPKTEALHTAIDEWLTEETTGESTQEADEQ